MPKRILDICHTDVDFFDIGILVNFFITVVKNNKFFAQGDSLQCMRTESTSLEHQRCLICGNSDLPVARLTFTGFGGPRFTPNRAVFTWFRKATRYSSNCTQSKCKHPSEEAVTHQELRHPNGSEQG